MVTFALLVLAGIALGFGFLFFRSRQAWRSALRDYEGMLAAEGLLTPCDEKSPGLPLQSGPDRLMALATHIIAQPTDMAQPQDMAEQSDVPAHRPGEVQHFIGTILDRIDLEVDTAIQGVIDNASHMAGRADAMASAAEIANMNADDVNTAVQGMVVSTENVSQTAGTLDQSVTDTRGQVEQAATITRTAVAKCDTAAQSIADLTEAVTAIDDITMLISSVAEQTNLLALNATIEAARAGDAGRGFAVVAGEVKTLATQTAKSTESIKQKIVETNRLAQAAQDQFQQVNAIVREVETVAETVSQAIQEQARSASNIATKSAVILKGTQSASFSLNEIKNDAQESDSLAQEVRDGVLGINSSIAAMRKAIGGILNETRQFAGRRRYERMTCEPPVTVPVRIETGPNAQRLDHSVELVNLSQGGALLRLVDGAIDPNVITGLTLPGPHDSVTPLTVVATIGENNIRVRFDDLIDLDRFKAICVAFDVTPEAPDAIPVTEDAA